MAIMNQFVQAREYDDPQGLHEKTEVLLREWVNIYHSPTSGRDSTRGFATFVHQVTFDIFAILYVVINVQSLIFLIL